MIIFRSGKYRLFQRYLHSTRVLAGQKPYNWYFDQLERDEKEAEFNAWLEEQPLLPPVRIAGHKRTRCFFDYASRVSVVDTGDQENRSEESNVTPLGRVVFELCDDYLPETCNNFKQLCEGTKLSYDPDQPATYKNTKVDQVLKDKFICGGRTDIPVFPFDDEGFIIRQRKGILGMNAAGVHQNTSHFYILLQDSFHLQGHNVSFGAVVEGLDIVQQIGDGLARRGKLVSDVVITNCGILPET